MKKLLMSAGAVVAAALGGFGNTLEGKGIPAEQGKAAPPKRKTAKKKAKRKQALPNYYSRSRWTPGGEFRNCGDKGISPKLMERVNDRR